MFFVTTFTFGACWISDTPQAWSALKYVDKHSYSLKVNQTSLSSKPLISHRKGAVECWVNGLLLLKFTYKKKSEKEKKIFSTLWIQGFLQGWSRNKQQLSSNSLPPAPPLHPPVCPLHPGLAPQPGSTPSRGGRPAGPSQRCQDHPACHGPACCQWLTPLLLMNDLEKNHGNSQDRFHFSHPYPLGEQTLTCWEVPTDGVSIPLSSAWWQSQCISPAFTCPLTLSLIPPLMGLAVRSGFMGNLCSFALTVQVINDHILQFIYAVIDT